MKKKFIRYGYALMLISCLCAIFSHGPHGGWLLGFIISCFLGMILSAAIWLIRIKGWIKYLMSVLIPFITLISGFVFIKRLPVWEAVWLGNLVSILIVFLCYVILIEACNFIWNKLGIKMNNN